jgi:RNA polymerase sigma-32 factor
MVAAEDDGVRSYATQVMQFPILSAGEEVALARRWRDHGDRAAFDRLVVSYLKLVMKVAYGFRGYGLPMADLISEGNIGLVRAVERFDLEKGFRLSTFAVWWIRAMVGDHIIRNWSLVRIGSNADQKKIFFNLNRAKRKLGLRDEVDLSTRDVDALARLMGTGSGQIASMNVRMLPTVSLNTPKFSDDPDGGEIMDSIPDKSANPEEILVGQDEHERRVALIGQAVESLKDRERVIFEARCLAEDPETLEQLAVKFGVSRERIRQIEVRAFEKVQDHVVLAAADAELIERV